MALVKKQIKLCEDNREDKITTRALQNHSQRKMKSTTTKRTQNPSIVIDILKYILPAVILIASLSPVNCIPTTPVSSWVDPCNIDVSTDSHYDWSSVPTPGNTLADTLSIIGTMAGRALDVTERLLSKFTSKRFDNPDIPALLEDYRLNGMPHVNPTPQSITTLSGKPISETLLQAYHNLSLVAVHIEQVRLDEITHEGGVFKADIHSIEDKLRNLMCNVDVELRRQQIVIDDHVTRDVMRVEYRNIVSGMIRRQRDFLILRDTKKLAYFLQILFTELADKV
ncbi:unnamed protein product [Owenia fusiformis]|uniref:Uncharacterized protein n=1 Tax=Owenia fusiformis TaxID=6347 RepID=A0A8J1T7J6_OWEFU|nr:unnamed protein product [Owenia fusiformis]